MTFNVKRGLMSDRRQFLSVAALGVAFGVPGFARPADSGQTKVPVGARIPKLEFVYECDATLAPAVEMGKTVEGQRRIIPITGGTVRGPRIRAELLSGGWDWNLSRNDGAASVEAAYYMKTDDGILIRIVNKGVGVSDSEPSATDNGERFYMFTTPTFQAPQGKYDWLNRSVFIATLGARKDARDSVLIRVFRLN